jgi:signal transduction histidine kinase
VNDLLAVSRIDAGRFGLEPANLDLAALARDVGEAFPTDETHPIRVTTPSVPVIVVADRRRIVETIENLLANAVKYSPEGGAIDVDVATDGDDHAIVRVRDRGFGIPPEERPFVFQRFFRTSRAKALGGVGLGLYISREIIERHGGSLDVESTSESGSTFVITLPLVKSPLPGGAQPPATSPSAAGRGSLPDPRGGRS